MKKIRWTYILIVLFLGGNSFYFWTKKENIYIIFDGDKQYTYRYLDLNGKSIDSLEIENLDKIVISGGDLLSYSWFEVNLDLAKHSKIDFSDCRKLIVNSPSFITNNYLRENDKDVSKFRLYIIINKNNSYYIIPVKNVSYSVY